MSILPRNGNGLCFGIGCGWICVSYIMATMLRNMIYNITTLLMYSRNIYHFDPKMFIIMGDRMNL